MHSSLFRRRLSLPLSLPQSLRRTVAQQRQTIQCLAALESRYSYDLEGAKMLIRFRDEKIARLCAKEGGEVESCADLKKEIQVGEAGGGNRRRDEIDRRWANRISNEIDSEPIDWTMKPTVC